MTTLSPSDGHTVLINTFDVVPERADELLALLTEATEKTMRHMPGFVSANLHVSLDRRRVVNYAQWRSAEDFHAMLENAEAGIHMRKAAEIAERFDPVLYGLEFTDTLDAAG